MNGRQDHVGGEKRGRKKRQELMTEKINDVSEGEAKKRSSFISSTCPIFLY